ncbi:MAG: TPR repeat protein [Amphiamblys sp. WSBS2006]|nr:MAG: TPR repeat protein [Amphiamblys sp. WSBS2006]
MKQGMLPERNGEHGTKHIDDLLNKIPFFADTIPGNMEEHPDFQALQQLADEGTPEEKAATYKEHGDDFYSQAGRCRDPADKVLSLRNARTYYTRGIETGTSEEAVLCGLYKNRSVVEFYMGNHAAQIKDCDRALEIGGECIRTRARKADALFRTGRYGEALLETEEILKKEKNRKVEELQEKIQAEIERENKKKMKQGKIAEIESEMKKRHIAVGEKNHFDIILHSGVDRDAVFPFVRKGTMFWTVLFLYPHYGRYDVVTEVSEADCLEKHIELLLGECDWDCDGVYSKRKRASVFFIDNNRKIEIDRKETLGAGLQKEGVFVSDCFPVFYVLPS